MVKGLRLDSSTLPCQFMDAISENGLKKRWLEYYSASGRMAVRIKMTEAPVANTKKTPT